MELFSDPAVDTLLETTLVLFEQVAAGMTGAVGDLELSAPAMVELLDSWNRTEEPFPADKTLHAVFEEAAATWPDAEAVVYRDTVLTYRELNERANQVAHHLLSRAALRADDLVALVLDKSELMMVAILAVWKTGAAYVPIDADYPDDRIGYMLEDTDCRLILTNRDYATRLRSLADDAGRPVLALEDLRLEGAPKGNPATATTSTDLAYAIYTSGTTGRPKAVLVEHRGVVNLRTSMARLFALDKHRTDEAVLSFSNYVFDHFVEQMTDALLNGQKLVAIRPADQHVRLAHRRGAALPLHQRPPGHVSLRHAVRALALRLLVDDVVAAHRRHRRGLHRAGLRQDPEHVPRRRRQRLRADRDLHHQPQTAVPAG